jgi:hypothetical protein
MIELTSKDVAIRSVLSLHCHLPPDPDGLNIIGPYCAECVSPIDGGPELYPCMTVKTVMDSLCGRVTG